MLVVPDFAVPKNNKSGERRRKVGQVNAASVRGDEGGGGGEGEKGDVGKSIKSSECEC